MCRSSFLNLPDRPNFRRTNWPNFQARLEDEIPIILDLHNGVAIDTCVENLSSTIMKAVAASTPKSHPRDDPPSPILAGIRDLILLKNRLQRQWQFTGTPFWELRTAACKGRWPTSWMSGGKTSGVRHLNPLIPKINPCGGSPNGWWEFLLLLPPGHPGGGGYRSLGHREIRSPGWQSRGSVAADIGSFGPGNYWDGGCGADVLLPDPCQWTPM
jgi:hypothetical protein